MKKLHFMERCRDWAAEAGAQFKLNPVVMLAQSALETGWGTSSLARNYNNYFGITAYGRANDFWKGDFVRVGSNPEKFRHYEHPWQSFMDYGRLLRARYPMAAQMSFHIEAFAQEIAYSSYISEKNGDNRESYRGNIICLSREIQELGTAPSIPQKGR